MAVFEEIRKLHAEGLYDDLKLVISFLLTKSSRGQKSSVTAAQLYQLHVFCGDAYYASSDFKKAERLYNTALGYRREMRRETPDRLTDRTQLMETTSEALLRYKLHKVLLDLKQISSAMSMLEAVQAKDRTPAINMALAKLYASKGQDRSAITCYKEVLRCCPLSLEAANGLIALGYKCHQVTTTMASTFVTLEEENWIIQWVKAKAELAEKQYSKAISTLRHMVDTTLKHNVAVLDALGEAFYLSGRYADAKFAWQQVYLEDPFYRRNVDRLALVYLEEQDRTELEKLSSRDFGVSLATAVEPWLVAAAYCLMSTKPTKALYLAQKAIRIQSKCYIGWFLKGLALLATNNSADGIQQFREGIRMEPFRIECYKGVIEAYLSGNRVREAIAMAGVACKQFGSTATTLYLYGRCLSKDPINIEKAKSYLEKSIKFDPNFLHSVYALAEILLQQEKYDRGCQLLQACMKDNSSSKLHRLLGDFLQQSGDNSEALNQYQIASNVDQTDKRAQECLEKAEMNMDSYMDQLDQSSERDLNESDLASLAWSDGELSTSPM